VHLTLIATAAALIIVALTTKQYSAEVAKNELHRIQGLRSIWSPDIAYSLNPQHSNAVKLFEDFPAVQTKPKPDEGDFSVSNISLRNRICESIWDGREPNARSFVEIESNPVVVSAISPDAFDFHETLQDSFDSLIPKLPQTISGLEHWWDSLDYSRYQLFMPSDVDPRAIIGPEDLSDQYAKPTKRYAVYLGLFDSPASDCDIAIHPTHRVIKPQLIYSELGGLQFVAPYRNDHSGGMIHLLVGHFWHANLNRTNLASYLKVNEGQFRHAFEDLRRVAEVNGVDTFDKLDEVLSKAEVSDAPAFEAFGIKFPADVATLGGTIALLCVQLYFFLYLRKLYGALKPDDEGWNVPWIGMDSSRLGKAVFRATVVLLPVISLFFLGGEASIRLSRGYWDAEKWSLHFLAPFWEWHWTVQAKVGSLLIALIVSALLGALSWKYRPQLSPSELPSEPDYQI